MSLEVQLVFLEKKNREIVEWLFRRKISHFCIFLFSGNRRLNLKRKVTPFFRQIDENCFDEIFLACMLAVKLRAHFTENSVFRETAKLPS